MNNPQKQIRQAKQNIRVLKPFADMPVSSVEAERACLGAVLTKTNAYYKVSRIVDDGNAFFDLGHRILWGVFKYLVENGMAIDTVTVSERLRETGQIEAIPPSTLTQMVAECPTSVHAEVYARLIQRTYAKRQILSLAAGIEKTVTTAGEEVELEKVLVKIMALVDNLTESISKRVVMTMADHSHDHLTASEDARVKGEVVVGIDTGIPGLKETIGALFPGTYLFGARRHNGKTITLSTIALNAAIDGLKVLFVNCADGNEATVLSNFYGMECGLSPAMIRRRTWNAQQYSTYVNCVARMSELNLFIKHEIGITPRGIWAYAKIIQHTYGLDMIVIDYIQRVGIDSDVKYTNGQEKLAYISGAMNKIYKEFDVPVLYGAQLLRQSSPDIKPLIDHAKGSGSLEEDVDCGITLWQKDPSKPQLIISVQKNRETHFKGDTKAGFDNITGRVAHNYNRENIDADRKDIYQ